MASTEKTRGYRYPPSAVDAAAERIVTDVRGFEENWKDDPRNTAQAVLEVFLEAGVVVLSPDAARRPSTDVFVDPHIQDLRDRENEINDWLGNDPD